MKYLIYSNKEYTKAMSDDTIDINHIISYINTVPNFTAVAQKFAIFMSPDALKRFLRYACVYMNGCVHCGDRYSNCTCYRCKRVKTYRHEPHCNYVGSSCLNYPPRGHKAHGICFDCRRIIKPANYTSPLGKKGISNYPGLPVYYHECRTDTEPIHERESIGCPECGKKTISISCNVRGPKQSDKKAWQQLKKLYDNNDPMFTHEACGVERYLGKVLSPQDFTEYKQYVASIIRSLKTGSSL